MGASASRNLLFQ